MTEGGFQSINNMLLKSLEMLEWSLLPEMNLGIIDSLCDIFVRDGFVRPEYSYLEVCQVDMVSFHCHFNFFSYSGMLHHGLDVMRDSIISNLQSRIIKTSIEENNFSLHSSNCSIVC